MDYADIQPLLVQWVKVLTGLSVVVWENEPRPYAPGALGLLSWVGEDDRGDTDVRYETDETGNVTPVRVNFAVLTLQIAVETLAQTVPNARAILSSIRSRVGRSEAREILKQANVGIVGFDTTTQADYRFEQRMVSRALLTVRLNATTFDRDTSDTGGWIESVDVTSHYKTPGNAEEPSALQMTAEQVP